MRSHLSTTVLLLLPLAACAGPNGTSDTVTAGTDAQFVQTAYQDDLAEELAAGYAETGARSPSVKAFATRMMADHDNMAIGLRQVATAQGMTLPTSPSEAQLAAIRSISTNKGGAFDKAYVADEITRHREMLQLYQAEAGSGGNTAIRQYASARLNVVQYNLAAVEALPTQD